MYFHRCSDAAPATAFLTCRGNRAFLVTNYHVLTGRDAFTGDFLKEGRGEVIGLKVHLLGGDLGSIDLSVEIIHGSKRNWLQHPTLMTCDIGCIEVQLPAEVTLHDAMSFDYHAPLYKRPGADCFILGFPLPDYGHFGTFGKRRLPIWKRGSLASEFEDNPFGLPVVLIDSATYSGMSGSPAFLRQAGKILWETGEASMWSDVASEFLGIYSGRMLLKDDRDAASQIGLVWKRHLIDEILEQA